MSFQAMAWASEQTTGSVTRKAVLYALANHANKEGNCSLRVETICEEAEIKQTAAKTALADLVKGGFLIRKRRRRENGNLGCYDFRLLLGTANGSRPETANDSHEPGRPSEPEPLAKPSVPRERNLVWDALVEVTSFAPVGRSETSDFGKTVSEIKSMIPADATAEQIVAAMQARKRAFESHYGEATFTHRVLRNRWTELGALAVGSGVPSRGAFPFRELPEGETF